MPRLTQFNRSILRAIDRLVVKIDAHGVHLRGRGRKTWRFASWEQIASLADKSQPVLVCIEASEGAAILQKLITPRKSPRFSDPGGDSEKRDDPHVSWVCSGCGAQSGLVAHSEAKAAGWRLVQCGLLSLQLCAECEIKMDVHQEPGKEEA